MSFFLSQEDSRWVLWWPVALGCGIAFYFSLSFEPTWRQVLWLSIPLAGSSCLFLYNQPPVRRFCAWGVFWCVIGFDLIFIRVWHMDSFPIARTIAPQWLKGTIYTLDHPASSARLFQRMIFQPDPKYGLPRRVIINVRTFSDPLQEGQYVRLKTKLQPLSGPCFPGAHNPQRQYFFQGIGATGFALTPVRVLANHPALFSTWRHNLTRRMHALLPPPLGAVACGLLTGDKVALPPHTRQYFSDSGLSHLLAIAGLHVSIVSGLCFMIFQYSLARIPYLALYLNLDKISAFLSLIVGWIYLNISGQRYPSQRAFFMMAAAMMAMLLSRRHHSMRILMLCALTFLVMEPEALLTMSYQLSFIAVAGLIAFYEARLARRQAKPFIPRRKKSKWRTLGHFIKDSLWSTAAITIATWPVMMFHFYHVSLQGFLSNLIAIPFTAFIIMPGAIIALLSLATPWSPFIFWLWSYSLQGLVGIAKISALYFSFLLFHNNPYSEIIFCVQVLSTLWILLWQERWRWFGLLPWALSMLAAHTCGIRPTFLVDAQHQLVGYLDYPQKTLWVSSMRKGKFARERWTSAYHLAHTRLLAENTIIPFAHGRSVSFFPLSPVHTSFTISAGKAFCAPPCLILSKLIPGASYAITGAGDRIWNSNENRPWSLTYHHP